MGSKDSPNTSAAVGQALCGMVHDISNVVQTVLLRAEVAMVSEELGEEVCGAFEQVMDDSKKSVEVLRYLLENSRDQVEHLPPVDISRVIEGAVAELTGPASAMGELAFTGATTPLVTPADESQLKELVEILVEELFIGGDSETVLKVTVAKNDDAPAALSDNANQWMAQMPGIKLTFVRDGVGAPLEIEDGALKLPTSMDEPKSTLQLLRAKGIIRQHRGQFRVTESVDDSSQQLSMEIYLPFQGG